MVDSQGRQGGSTDAYTVNASDDSSCINADSPGSTAQSTAAATSTASSAPTPPGTTNNAAVIGASIAGGAVFLIALASLVWFILQRKHRRRKHDEDESSIQGMTHKQKRNGRSVDLIPDDRSGHSDLEARGPRTADPLQPHTEGRSVYEPDPYVLPPPPESQGLFEHVNDEGRDEGLSGASGSPRQTRGMSVGTTATSGMSGTSKAQLAAPGSARPYGTQRFVLHTDAGEVDDDEVVELPPTYTQVQPRRGNTPAAPASSISHGATNGSHADDPLRS
ncbi:hypothetical protein FRC12_020287 [Ceratobasidium sp. 428]|nr:hypothetical protein FRC12_020287 [Ceratobasidium sp. 428]